MEFDKGVLSNCCKVFCGLSKTGFRDSVTSEEKIADEQYAPFVESRQIYKYFVSTDKYILKSVFNKKPLKAFSGSCIFIARMTSNIRAGLSMPGQTAGKVNVLHDFINADIKYVLALINSKLINYYYGIKNESKHLNGGAFGFDVPSIEELPMILPDDQQPFIDLVDRIIEIKTNKFSGDTKLLEEEIDRMVYGLYGLTDDEVAIIEQQQ